MNQIGGWALRVAGVLVIVHGWPLWDNGWWALACIALVALGLVLIDAGRKLWDRPRYSWVCKLCPPRAAFKTSGNDLATIDNLIEVHTLQHFKEGR